MAKGKAARSCEVCKLLQDSKSFARGSKVKIVFDCKTCEARLAQPLVSNENIIAIYEALPANYSGLSEYKTIASEDIKFLFEIFDVPRTWWEDYYNRIMYFHFCFIVAKEKISAAEQKAQDKDKKPLPSAPRNR